MIENRSESAALDGCANKASCEASKPDFGILVTQHGKYLKSFIRKKLWASDEVDDVYQIVLLESFKSYRNFRNESHPRTWMCGVAAKVISNYIRKKAQSAVDFTDEIEQTSDKHSDSMELNSIYYRDPEESYQYLQMENDVNGAMSRLPEKMKKVFETVVQDGYSYEDASRIHNIPVGTVRSRVFFARKFLKGVCASI